MHMENELLGTAPFDLYELSLFHLVATEGSFTRAAEKAGRTQSTVTRQIQDMERSLGLALFERTTRRVRLTPAGEFLQGESARLLGDVDEALRRLREDYAGARKEVRVGVSRSLGLAHLPGFFHANRRRQPEVTCRVQCQPSAEILSALENHTLDLGVLCPPPRLPRPLQITHRFRDNFTLVAPAESAREFQALPRSVAARRAWLQRQSWLLLGEHSHTGRQLRVWLQAQGWTITPAMALDSFDLIINLVALGMGVSFVPVRALALYGQKRQLARLKLPVTFTRELVVVTRRQRRPPEHVRRFVENILF